MPEWTLHAWLIVAHGAATALFAVMTFIVMLLAWLRPRHPKSDPSREIKRFEAYQVKEFPEIHATSGVPTLSQLMAGIELDRRRLGVARNFYEVGLAQFNHFVNNRDRVIEESRSKMASLAGSLSQTEICNAQGIGESLAAVEDCEQVETAQAQYRDLSPQAQIYAQHKRHETVAIRSIARDLETNTPRTDYTSVIARIASGTVKLDSILSELPICWQAIRTLNDKVQRPVLAGKPPKREFLHVMVMTRGRRLLEDKHAEKDGNWIISDKLGLELPYQDPVPTFVQLEEGAPSVRNGEAVIITHDQGSEWHTELWRKGGRLDQVYLRARDWMSPVQLENAYRRRLTRRVIWTVFGVLLIVDAVLLATRYLG